MVVVSDMMRRVAVGTIRKSGRKMKIVATNPPRLSCCRAGDVQGRPWHGRD